MNELSSAVRRHEAYTTRKLLPPSMVWAFATTVKGRWEMHRPCSNKLFKAVRKH